jgi:hypothetical protein
VIGYNSSVSSLENVYHIFFLFLFSAESKQHLRTATTASKKKKMDFFTAIKECERAANSFTKAAERMLRQIFSLLI